MVSDALLAISGKRVLSTEDFTRRGCLNSVFRKKRQISMFVRNYLACALAFFSKQAFYSAEGLSTCCCTAVLLRAYNFRLQGTYFGQFKSHWTETGQTGCLTRRELCYAKNTQLFSTCMNWFGFILWLHLTSCTFLSSSYKKKQKQNLPLITKACRQFNVENKDFEIVDIFMFQEQVRNVRCGYF